MFWNWFNPLKDWDKELDKKIKDAVKPWQDDIKFLQSMQKLEIKEGDIVVLRHPCRLSEQAIANLKTQLKALYTGGFNVKVMVLEDGMDIGVLRREAVK